MPREDHLSSQNAENIPVRLHIIICDAGDGMLFTDMADTGMPDERMTKLDIMMGDFKKKIYQHENQKIELCIWKERSQSDNDLRSIERSIYQGGCSRGSGLIFLCDANDRDGLAKKQRMIAEFPYRHSFPIALVLAKTDCGPAKICFSELESYASNIGVQAFEMVADVRSYKTDDVTQQARHAAATKLLAPFISKLLHQVRPSAPVVSPILQAGTQQLTESNAQRYLDCFTNIVNSDIFASEARRNLFTGVPVAPKTIIDIYAVLTNADFPSAREKLTEIHRIAKKAHNANVFTQTCGYLFKGRSDYTNLFYRAIRNINPQSDINIAIPILQAALKPYTDKLLGLAGFDDKPDVCSLRKQL